MEENLGHTKVLARSDPPKARKAPMAPLFSAGEGLSVPGQSSPAALSRGEPGTRGTERTCPGEAAPAAQRWTPDSARSVLPIVQRALNRGDILY